MILTVIIKFKIKDNDNNKRYRINWRDENSIPKSKYFRYVECSKEEAFIKAETFREELINKFY